MNLVPLEIGSRSLVMDYLRRFPPEVSELTFTNLFVWRHSRPVWIVELDGVLVFLCPAPDGRAGKCILGPPVGGWPNPHGLRAAIPDLAGYVRITEAAAGKLAEAGLAVTSDDANADYVYRTSDLAELRGEKYHKKRNLISQCVESHTCRYEALTARTIPDCLASLDQWCLARQADLTPGMAAEYRAIRELFDHYRELELQGGVVLVDGCAQAYAVGEALAPDTAVCHFEKADPQVKGLSQRVNQGFAASMMAFEYLNREQDLGVPGLRQSKRSYYPHHMVRKFVAMFRE